MSCHDSVRPVEWSDDTLWLLDQRLLPAEEKRLAVCDVAGAADAIRSMVVRGAPAIGIAAAYGVALAVRDLHARAGAGWRDALDAPLGALTEARPTAVNLSWAVARMRRRLLASDGAQPFAVALEEARRIHTEDVRDNRRMGTLGASLLNGTDSVLTHCNAGSLATGGYGTALGVVRACAEAGRVLHVYADETRPWLQGARLTAWELQRDGIPVTLICDAAAASLMQRRRIQAVLVGADRIARNGDVANKIGTYGLAIAARHHRVPFIVVAPTSTIDPAVACGADIPLEERPLEELVALAGHDLAPAGTAAWNPVFDVTPAALVSALVTERGVCRAPDRAGVDALLGRGVAAGT